MRARNVAAVLAIVTGLGCLVAAGTSLETRKLEPSSFGVTQVGGSPMLASPDPVSGASSTSAGPGTAASVALVSKVLADPVELLVPRLGVDAPVVPVMAHGASLEVPTDARRVGWWVGSARPGAPSGSVVLDGHVDTVKQGAGALYGLDELRAGDAVVVVTPSLRKRYRVVGRRVYPKAAGLPKSLFQPTRTPRLVLVSCGGAFDETTRSYADNVAVFAAPE